MNTNYFADLVAGNLFGTKKSPGIPTTFYLGLSKTPPTASGSNVTEPIGGGYSRIRVTNLSVPSGGIVTNNSELVFNESSSNWGELTHFLLFDSPSGGNLLMYGALANSRNVEIGTTLSLRPNSLKLMVQSPV